MRSNILLLTLALPFMWEIVIPSQGRPSAEIGDSNITKEAERMKFKPGEWRSLNERKVVTRSLGGNHAREMAGFGAMIADATPAEFIKAFNSLSVFKRSETTLACGRFSAKPVIEDLVGLEINDKDLYALMRAKVKESDIKLTEPDISRIRNIAGSAPYFSTKLKSKLGAEYKQILLDKASAYTEKGESALDVYADQEEPVSARDAFEAMARFQMAGAGYNAQFFSLPGQPAHDTTKLKSESFIYWALQKFGQLKPVISLVHVVISTENDHVFIASKQIYSSHYTEAGLSVAELIPFNGEKGEKRTLAAYTIHLQVDLLGGPMGFIKRRAAQPRMLETIRTGLEGLRQCAETLFASVTN